MKSRNQPPNRLGAGVVQPSTLSIGLIDPHVEISVTLLTVQADSDRVVQANYHARYLPRRQGLQFPYAVSRGFRVRVRVLDGRSHRGVRVAGTEVVFLDCVVGRLKKLRLDALERQVGVLVEAVQIIVRDRLEQPVVC